MGYKYCLYRTISRYMKWVPKIPSKPLRLTLLEKNKKGFLYFTIYVIFAVAFYAILQIFRES